MSGILELWAKQLGWRICKGNVIVEGDSDVFYFEHAARLYAHKHSVDPLGDDLSVISAGQGDAGGVDGVNERFRTAHQLSQLDLHPSGEPKYRFIALFDNDEPGRRAFSRGANFSPLVKGYRELFLLHPVMPLANGATPSVIGQRAADLNRDFPQLQWEIEDLISPDLWALFEVDYKHEITWSREIGGKTHRDLTWTGKVRLKEYVLEYAQLEDMQGVIILIRALRTYLRLRADHLLL